MRSFSFNDKGGESMENEKAYSKERITPEKALKMLQAKGMEVTLEQAGKILEFLRKLANMTVANYLKKKKGKKR